MQEQFPAGVNHSESVYVVFIDQHRPWRWACGQPKGCPNLFPQICGQAKKRSPPRQWKYLNSRKTHQETNKTRRKSKKKKGWW